MEIKFKLDLDQETEERLMDALNCKQSELAKTLSLQGKAALQEYIEMFCGNTSLRSIVDTREQRLLQIMLAAYEGAIPDEPTVSRLFHLTRAQARSLLRSVLERKAFELKEHLRKSCVAVLETVDPNATPPIQITIRNPRVYEALDQILIDDGRVPLLEKLGVTKYGLDKGSLAVLRKHFAMGGGTGGG